jgi:DNA repair exonuclease SbcCD ATPase subunit
MMFVRRVLLKNFGCHRDLKVELSRGIVGVFGPNWSGKSTFVDSIYAILTNDFSGRFPVKKKELIHFDAWTSKEEAFGEVVLDIDGEAVTVRRNLRDGSSQIHRESSSAVIQGEAGVETELKKLGVEADILKRYVFIQQTELTHFLDSSPAERRKAFQGLCETQRAEKIWEACGKILDADHKLIIPADSQVEDAEETARVLRNRLDECRQHLAGLQKRRLGPQRLKDLKERVETTDRHMFLVSRIAELQSLLAGTEEIDEEVQEAYSRLQELTEQVADTEQRLIEAKQAAMVLESFSRLDLLLTQRADPGIDNEISAVEAEIQSLQTASAGMRAASQLKPDRPCPTCLQPVSAAVHRRAVNHFTKAKSGLADLSTLQEKLVSLKTTRSISDRTRGELEKLQAQLSAVKRPKSIPDVAGLERNLRSAKSICASTKSALEEKQKAREASSAKFAEHKTRLAELKTDLERIDTKKLLDDEGLIASKRRLAEQEKLDLAILQAASDVRAAEAAWNHAESVVKAKKEQRAAIVESNKRVEEWLKRVTSVREVFHRDNFPSRLAEQRLKAIEGDVNRLLSMFGNPFTATAEEDLRYSIQCEGSPPTYWMSVGQRSILALAHYLASLRTFCERIGILCLDEPTAFLDAANLSYMRDCLTTFRGATRKENLQVIVVTHAKELREAFHQTVEFSSGEDE